MTAQLLDGKKIANDIKETLKITIANLIQSEQPVPGLAVILVGQDAASEVYVANKRKACAEVGICSHAIDLPDSTTNDQLIALIQQLNTDDAINGILVQLPLPKLINSNSIIECILPSKDVDGFHPWNLGRLAQRNPALRPCTPYGIMQLLSAYNLSVQGKHVVIVGASNIVGRPMALECLLAGATVTVCHRFTQHLEQHIRLADVIVVATGIYNIINPEWLNYNQIVIDVGMHRLPNGKLHGDMNFEKAVGRVAWITPVPGGVGPMTIATLLSNTLISYQRQHASKLVSI